MSPRRTYVHVGANVVAQGLIMGLQLLYIAWVSRALPPAAFGAYAIAVLVTTLGNLIAGTGLGQAVARKQHLESADGRSLVSAALLIGIILAVVTAMTAPLWGLLWGNPDAVPLIIALSLGMPAVAAMSVQRGLLRRGLESQKWAGANIAGNVIGLSVGAAFVAVVRQPWTLCVAPVATVLATVALLVPILGVAGYPGRLLRGTWPDVAFGAKSSGTGVMAYFSFGLPVWATSFTLGPTVLGNWNRSVAIGQVPVDAVTTSVTTVVFHRFANERLGPRERTDLLRASILILLPIAGSLLPLSPLVTRVVLGPQWVLAPLMVPWLVAGAVFTLHSSLLVMALEARGRFATMVAGQAAGFVVLASCTVAILITGEWYYLAIGFALTPLAIHVSQAAIASRSGLIWGHRLAPRYIAAFLVLASMLVEAHVVRLLWPGAAAVTINSIALLTTSVFVLWRYRHRWGLVPHRVINGS